MRKVVILALVAAMLTAFSAEGFRSDAGAASTGRDVELSVSDSTLTDYGDKTLVRAHPRGLP